jgi:hypothetical protein
MKREREDIMPFNVFSDLLFKYEKYEEKMLVKAFR